MEGTELAKILPYYPDINISIPENVKQEHVETWLAYTSVLGIFTLITDMLLEDYWLYEPTALQASDLWDHWHLYRDMLDGMCATLDLPRVVPPPKHMFQTIVARTRLSSRVSHWSWAEREHALRYRLYRCWNLDMFLRPQTGDVPRLNADTVTRFRMAGVTLFGMYWSSDDNENPMKFYLQQQRKTVAEAIRKRSWSVFCGEEQPEVYTQSAEEFVAECTRERPASLKVKRLRLF